jgi:hypothetical protein
LYYSGPRNQCNAALASRKITDNQAVEALIGTLLGDKTASVILTSNIKKKIMGEMRRH